MACRHAVASASAMVRMPPINLNLSLAVVADFLKLKVFETRVFALNALFVACGNAVLGSAVWCV